MPSDFNAYCISINGSHVGHDGGGSHGDGHGLAEEIVIQINELMRNALLIESDGFCFAILPELYILDHALPPFLSLLFLFFYTFRQSSSPKNDEVGSVALTAAMKVCFVCAEGGRLPVEVVQVPQVNATAVKDGIHRRGRTSFAL
ncbi:unnamed protein product [Victoria cruziana]